MDETMSARLQRAGRQTWTALTLNREPDNRGSGRVGRRGITVCSTYCLFWEIGVLSAAPGKDPKPSYKPDRYQARPLSWRMGHP